MMKDSQASWFVSTRIFLKINDVIENEVKQSLKQVQSEK